ncbi:MAG: hypothetical protein A3G24_18455 [Betaproteobacteria bacterium RIFCSPLOWO2_12_FULL_62_13]|nr:MAG: hypothetical protein A3G24_18455 [Betaproteobacteria bacterium RIFCSPLOWO2_12_FULL_62_13]
MNGETAQRYARIAGVLFLLSIVAGGFGEAYVPSKLVVSGDAAATAANLRASDLLFRAGFASYLVEALCDIALSLVMYILLRPVHRDLALLAAFFGLVSTAVFACAQLFHFAALLFIGDADYLRTFSPDQLNTLMLLSLKVSGYGGGIFMVFYGVASVLRGYLILRSGYLPKFLGALLLLAGLGFITKNFLLVLAPRYASDVFLLPMFLAAVSLAAWLLVRGVDVAKWPRNAEAPA